MILSKPEIIDLTGCRKHGAQAAVLRSFGLEVKQLPTGQPIVALDNFRRVFGCDAPAAKPKKAVSLDFSGLNDAEGKA